MIWKNLTRACLVATVLVATGLRPAIGQETNGVVPSVGSVAGDWALNRALSDDPGEQLQNVRGGARPSTGGAPGGRPAPGGRLDFDELRRAVEQFGIEQSDSTVVVAYPDRELVLFTDGRKQEVQLRGDRKAEYRSWWDRGRLFIERKLDGGMALTEEYWILTETGRLHVLTRLEGDRLPRTIAFMRVYDPAAEEAED